LVIYNVVILFYHSYWEFFKGLIVSRSWSRKVWTLKF